MPLRLAPALAAVLLALAPHGAGAQDVAARPASVGVRLVADGDGPRVERVLAGGPAARGGIRPGDRVVAVDGRPAGGLTPGAAEALLTGAPGDTVRLTVLSAGRAARVIPLPREDVFAPGAGYTEAVRDGAFVLHHRPGVVARRAARALAARARGAAERELGEAGMGGRRVHLYLLEPGTATSETTRGRGDLLPWWAGWVRVEPMRPERTFGSELAYLRFGEPGRAVADRLGGRMGWGMPADDLHRAAVRELMSAGLTAASSPEELARVGPGISSAGASLRAYLRERVGDRRFAALWGSPEPFDVAVARSLGLSEREVLADWSAKIFGLGPDDAAGPGVAAMAVGLGWGAVLLLLGMRIARRKEV